MNLIDFHVHIGDFDLIRDDIQGLLTKFSFETDVEVKDVFSNKDFLKHYLKSKGVKKAVVLAECGPGTNFTIDSKMVSDFCFNDNFFIPFGNINPNFHEDVVSEWENGLELGVRGYKFYPADHDFDALSSGMMEVYERCEKEGQIIMFHTGLTGQRDSSQKFIKPYEFLPIVEKFKNLTVVFAHGGKPNWYDQAVDMAVKYPNVYLDTALVPVSSVAEWVEKNDVMKSKILFGSDLPVSGGYSKLLKRFEHELLSSDVMEQIMFSNANDLLFNNKFLLNNAEESADVV